jgi:hypothetical protein
MDGPELRRALDVDLPGEIRLANVGNPTYAPSHHGPITTRIQASVAERPVALPPETTEALAMLIELAKLAPISLWA